MEKIKFSIESFNNETIITLSEEPQGLILDNLNLFIKKRRGHFISERHYLKFILPYSISAKHLQTLFDSLNLPFINSILKPKPYLSSFDIMQHNNSEKEIEEQYISFGKYKGMKYIHIEESYLKWIIKTNRVKNIVSLAEKALKRKEENILQFM